tara:strand:- start:500 stop:694 length:195 start_codon:yes stop_codon:yes gene_type:complete
MSIIDPILFIFDFLPALESKASSSKFETNKPSIDKKLNKYIKNKDIDNNKDKYVVFNPVFEIIK